MKNFVCCGQTHPIFAAFLYSLTFFPKIKGSSLFSRLDSINFIKAVPITMPSANFEIALTSLAVDMPKPTHMGRLVKCLRSLTWFSILKVSRWQLPVTPVFETRYKKT